MRIDLPACNLKNCRCYSDGNCKYRVEYEKCEYQMLRSYIYFVNDEDALKEHKADANRIIEAVERTKKYMRE